MTVYAFFLTDRSGARTDDPAMSRLVSRIMLALLMFPLGGLLYIVVVAGLMEFAFRNSQSPIAFSIAGTLVWMFVAGYWIMLWRPSVRWTQWRITTTIGAAVLVLVPALVGGTVLEQVGRGFGVFVGSLIAIILWLAATIFIWRESPDERAARIRLRGVGTLTCPSCGYNLTGLSEATCPECGAAYTIDELIALQPSRTSHELE